MSELPSAQELQAQVHFVDYQAMMTRVNWFMSLQFMPLVPLVGFYSFLAVASEHLNEVFVRWAGAIVTQIAVIIYYFALYEVYNHVRYIETKLKPKVAAILQLETTAFWGWEGHLKLVGKAYSPNIGDMLPAALSVIAFVISIIVTATATPVIKLDCVGMTISLLFLLGSVRLAGRVVKVRKEFESVT